MENEKNVDLEKVNSNSTSEVEFENSNQQETTKTYSEEELNQRLKEQRNKINQDNQVAWNKRWGQEKSKMEREFEKRNELANLLMKQTGTNSIDDLLNTTYQEYGMERPKNTRDEERLGKLDAQELLELNDEQIEEEANRLSYLDRTTREEATFMELSRYLTEKKEEAKRKEEIKESGIDESLLENQEFQEFMEKFNKNTSLKDIYEIYSQTQNKPAKKEKPFSAGSANGKKVKEESEFFTEEEFFALTKEDLKNPKIFEKAMKSRLNFG